MKETEEELFRRCCEEMAQKHFERSYKLLDLISKWALSFEISKIYASERLKASLPSEQEIEIHAKEYLSGIGNITYDLECKHDFTQGFKKALELLTTPKE